MEEKRENLDVEKRKRLLQRLVAEQSKAVPDLYYQPTAIVARLVKAAADKGNGLTQDDIALLRPLSERDIEVLLSLH